ncbi:hypothetical protein J5N97_028228 [Dioscorea zingiberensis]|uniref:Ethylene insensitive 3-like DNA-binding domain-containing protein n=1 Tax=Dioscorea zingiberensis TaxID=325984 RepID=A0A9D5H4N8_9LILI|nr:hypothetical protein J5N97_028228 [Dioscorea zingiberensis]
MLYGTSDHLIRSGKTSTFSSHRHNEIKKNEVSPVSGASDDLCGWWKEKIASYRDGPAIIAKYQADNVIPGVNSEMSSGALSPYSLQELQGTTLESLLHVYSDAAFPLWEKVLHCCGG